MLSVTRRLVLAYDGAVTTSHLDSTPDAAEAAREMAASVLRYSARAGVQRAV